MSKGGWGGEVGDGDWAEGRGGMRRANDEFVGGQFWGCGGGGLGIFEEG